MQEEEERAIKTAEAIKAGIPVGTCNDDYIHLLNLIQKQKAEIEKKDKMISEMLEEFTDCEMEFKCSECCCECEKDYDQLYYCNKEYFENLVKEKE